MPTQRQNNSRIAVDIVAQHFRCPRCEHTHATARYNPARVQCTNCNTVCAVRSVTTTATDPRTVEKMPQSLRGSAWPKIAPKVEAGDFTDLFILKRHPATGSAALWLLPAKHHTADMYQPAKPLKATALRAGWEGYTIDLSAALEEPEKIWVHIAE